MKYIKHIWLICIITLFSVFTNAQGSKITVQAPNQVRQNQQFRITYTLNQSGEFNAPNFSNFQFLGGPSVSKGSSVEIINGRTQSSYTESYTYYLQANKVGSFSLPTASVNIDGKIYKSPNRSIEVLKTTEAKTTASSNTQISNADFNPEGRVFLKIMPNKKTAYLGEPIIVTEKLYSKDRIANITDYKKPNYSGFWKDDIDIGELQLKQEVLNGETYNVVTLQKSIIFPQKTGKQTINSAQLDLIIQSVKKRKAQDRIEQMMYGNIIHYYSNENISVKSKPFNINIKKLPANKPKNFSGIVGNFNLKAEVDKTELKSNDALNFSIKIKGMGNIDLLEEPNIQFPPDFEVYDPKISKKTSKTESGVSGSKSYEYLIIPRNEGEYTIPSYCFSYFNPHTERYESCTSPEFNIKVGKGLSTNNTINSSVNRDEIKYIGKDIRHIKLVSDDFSEIKSHSFNSWKHITYIIVSTLIAIFLIITLKRREENTRNISLMRLKKAKKLAKKRLKTAYKHLQVSNNEQFYEEVSKALWGYIADKYDIKLNDLSIDKIKMELSIHDISDELINQLSEIIEHCEFARYSPSKDQKDLESIYYKSVELISNIEKSLKK